MKFINLMLSLCIICNIAYANPNDFSDFPVEVYNGKLRKPKAFDLDQNGDLWEYGKMVAKPTINFAGKYFVTLHSCGTGCRYFRMHDLTSGKELPVLKMFSSATEPEPPPMTKDGWKYITHLHHKKDSNLLVAQFSLEKEIFTEDGESEILSKCRERSYIFENEVLKPISKTRYTCTDYDNTRMPRKFWNKSP
jgi:hypothetical protein